MIIQKRTKWILSGIILACLFAGCILLFHFLRSIKHYTGCIISVQDHSLLIRFDISAQELESEHLMGSLYWVDTQNTGFLSTDASIQVSSDLKPGMLIHATVHSPAAFRPAVNPSVPDLYTVTQIETEGKTDDLLLQAGIEDLYAYGFGYADGKPYSMLTLN